VRAQAAEPFREKLLERGVLTVPVVLDGGVPELPELEEGDTKWRAKPVLIDKWKAWMTEQMSSANLEDGQAVYLSLRMDGRVRGSGKSPLPPSRGGWLVSGKDESRPQVADELPVRAVGVQVRAARRGRCCPCNCPSPPACGRASATASTASWASSRRSIEPVCTFD
jgi:hypothetical protein